MILSSTHPRFRTACRFLLCGLLQVVCSGCSLWVSENRAVCGTDLNLSDPYDGSRVYPLNAVVLGGQQRVRNLQSPLSMLEPRMSEDSQYAVIRAADCGILACYANDMQLASRALDRAIGLSEAALTDESQNSKVTGVGGSESAKIFAGEPHEIAAMYVFRGLVFLSRNDPENAKSCFLHASLADAMSTKDEARSNWLTADVLATLSFRLYGSNVRADDHVKMIGTTYPHTANDAGWIPDGVLMGIKRENLTIVIVCVGTAPVKYGKGALQYAESQSKVGSVHVHGDSAWLTDNVFVQAVTRGRRNMDDILAARQRRREDTETVGSVALGVAGAAGGLVGAAIQLIAGAAIDKAQEIDIDADSRQVSAVPGRFYVWASNSAKPGDRLDIELRNHVDRAIARGSVAVPIAAGRDPTVVLAWFPR